jgi:hypothetical protein
LFDPLLIACFLESFVKREQDRFHENSRKHHWQKPLDLASLLDNEPEEALSSPAERIATSGSLAAASAHERNETPPGRKTLVIGVQDMKNVL